MMRTPLSFQVATSALSAFQPSVFPELGITVSSQVNIVRNFLSDFLNSLDVLVGVSADLCLVVYLLTLGIGDACILAGDFLARVIDDAVCLIRC